MSDGTEIDETNFFISPLPTTMKSYNNYTLMLKEPALKREFNFSGIKGITYIRNDKDQYTGYTLCKSYTNVIAKLASGGSK